MSVMDGVHVAQALKANRQHAILPIVMLTAKAQDADILEACWSASKFTCQPFHPRDLIAWSRPPPDPSRE